MGAAPTDPGIFPIPSHLAVFPVEPCSRETCSGLHFQLPFKISSPIHSCISLGPPGRWATLSPILQGRIAASFPKELVGSKAPTSMAPMLSKPWRDGAPVSEGMKCIFLGQKMGGLERALEGLVMRRKEINGQRLTAEQSKMVHWGAKYDQKLGLSRA